MPGLRHLEDAKDPLAGVDPPVPPTAAVSRAPRINRISRTTWCLLLIVFIVSMLTWMPATWENVFNEGLAFSTIFLSITLITGMGGQLSLCQATLAGVGASTCAQARQPPRTAHDLGCVCGCPGRPLLLQWCSPSSPCV